VKTTVIGALFVVSAGCSTLGLVLLAQQARQAGRLLRDHSRHVADGGDVSGRTMGPNAATAFDDVLQGLRTPVWALALLISGIAAGLVGDLLSLCV
jgi:hypothetical protein